MQDYFLYLTIGAILIFTICLGIVSLGLTRREIAIREQPPHDR